MSSVIRRAAAAVVTAALAACSSDATAPASSTDVIAAEAAARPAEACVNVHATASGPLGIWFAGDYGLPGNFGGFGLAPSPITLGGIEGTIASFVDNEYISGIKDQGAHHIVLSHVFWADGEASWFRTLDKASCAPADDNPATCQVNDHLRIVDGVGIFANAAGQLHNHGLITFTSAAPPAGTLDLRIIGRVCGDGLSS